MKRITAVLACLVFILLILAGLLRARPEVLASPSDPRPTPTPLPPPPELRLAAAPAGIWDEFPDLVVTDLSFTPVTATINTTMTIRVVIKNQGQVDVRPDNNFFVDLYIDPPTPPVRLQSGDLSAGIQGWWMTAGTSRIITFAHVFTDTRTYNLYAQIDTDNHVQEANEDNNVLGPVPVTVRTATFIRQASYQDLQWGLASTLDISYPDGVIRLGVFAEPYDEPDIYYPDVRVNDNPTMTVPLGDLTTLYQVAPSLGMDTRGPDPILYLAWEDGRNGGAFNRDIYFASSIDRGTTWSTNVRVNWDDPITNTVNQLAPALAVDNSNGPYQGTVYVAWQDGRRGNYDIFLAYSTDQGRTWSPNIMVNDLSYPRDVTGTMMVTDTADQLSPAIFVDDLGRVYLAWTDRRNGNDDIYFAKSTDGGVTWTHPNVFVTDDPASTQQNQRSPSIVADLPGSYWYDRTIYIAWEDWRAPNHPEIYLALSRDGGQTFGVDVPVEANPYDAGLSYRLDPTLVTSRTVAYEEVLNPNPPPETIMVARPSTAIHVVWQDFGDDPDKPEIYYAWAFYPDPEVDPIYPYDVTFKPSLRVGGRLIDSRYAIPPERRPPGWTVQPAWRSFPSLTRAAEDFYFHVCYVDPPTGQFLCPTREIPYYMDGVYVAWSERRDPRDWNTDIYLARIGRAPDTNTYVVVGNVVLNDNVKIYRYRDDPVLYQKYRPAAARQYRPSLVADSQGRLYLAWDDDRYDDPLKNPFPTRDIFFVSGAYNIITVTQPVSGAYLSPVFDVGYMARWYVLDWWAVTEHGAEVTFQTRLGYSSTGQIEWSDWSRPYNAPGQHIVDTQGQPYPQSRYLQYKLNMRNSRLDLITAISEVALYYQKPNSIYLPAIFKSSVP